MNVIDKFLMFQVAVNDMPKAKDFYVDKLSLKITKEYRRDDNNWWVSLSLPEGGVTVTLTTHHMHMKPGTLTLYFSTSDITEAHKALRNKDVTINDIKDDLHGPGSGVKFFNFQDPDGNLIHIEQA